MLGTDAINVLYYSCPYDLSGYGSVSRNHLVNLEKYDDLNLRLRTKRFWTGVSPDLGSAGETLKKMEQNPISNDNFIEHLTPENFFVDPRAKYHISFTPFETDGAPIQWLLPLKAMDEIWVPSHYNKKAYVNMGVPSKKIFVIPHGIDPERFNPSVEPLKYDRGKFNFGSVFDWTERKNPTALIRAYYNAFFGKEDVTLTIRTFWRFPIENTKEYITNQVNAIKAGYKGRKKFPRILFWFNTMDEKVIPNFYRSFDCFVLPTRGEGFGLPFLEAMACGVPSIGPKMGGSTEFMNSDNSILVDGKKVSIKHHDFLSKQPQYAGQNWFDINEKELSESMRWAYDNKDKARDMGLKSSKEIRDKWTWEKTAALIRIRLLKINALLNEPEAIKDGGSFMGVSK